MVVPSYIPSLSQYTTMFLHRYSRLFNLLLVYYIIVKIKSQGIVYKVIEIIVVLCKLMTLLKFLKLLVV